MKESIIYATLIEALDLLKQEDKAKLLERLDSKMEYIKNTLVEPNSDVGKLRESYAIYIQIKNLIIT